MTDELLSIGKSIEALGEDFAKFKAERATADEMSKAEIDEKLKAIEEHIEKLQDAQKEAARAGIPGIEYARKGEKNKFSIHRAFKLIALPKEAWQTSDTSRDKECGYEIEVFNKMFDQMEGKTAINATTGAAGGFFLPNEVMSELIPELEAVSITAQLGVRRIDNLVGHVSWVRSAGGNTAYYVDSEAEATITESTTTFQALQMRPHALAAAVPLTYQMLRQPSISMEQFVRADLVNKLALKEDWAVLEGASNESEPRGIINTTGINTYSWEAAPVTTAVFSGAAQNISKGLRQMIYELAEDNALAAAVSPGWAMSPSAAFAISNTKDGDGHPLFLGMNEAVISNLLGYPLYYSTQIEQSGTTDERIIFGDWNQCINGHWGPIELASSDQTETNFRKLRTTIRAVTEHDVGVLQPTAFCNGTNFSVALAIS